jgi:hypothetical protein
VRAFAEFYLTNFEGAVECGAQQTTDKQTNKHTKPIHAAEAARARARAPPWGAPCVCVCLTRTALALPPAYPEPAHWRAAVERNAGRSPHAQPAHRGRSRPRRHGTPRRGRYLKTLDLSRVGSKVRADHAAPTRRRPLRSGDCRNHGRDLQEDQARWRLDDLHEQLEELGFV